MLEIVIIVSNLRTFVHSQRRMVKSHPQHTKEEMQVEYSGICVNFCYSKIFVKISNNIQEG